MLTLKQRWTLALHDPWYWAALISVGVELYFRNVYTLVAMTVIVIISAIQAKY